VNRLFTGISFNKFRSQISVVAHKLTRSTCFTSDVCFLFASWQASRKISVYLFNARGLSWFYWVS